MKELIAKIASDFAAALNSNELVVFLMSMLPIVEVRGGIPVGTDSLGLSPGVSYGYAILASVVVTPIILFLLKKVIHWMCKSKIFGSFGKALNGYFYEKAQKVEEGKIVKNKSKLFFKYLALYAFVAAPLPLTGYWTGSAIAVFMNLNPFISFVVIILGNLTAGGLVLLMTMLLGENAYIITLIFLLFIPIVLAILAYKLIKKRKAQKQSGEVINDKQGEIASTTNDITATQNFEETTLINDIEDSGKTTLDSTINSACEESKQEVVVETTTTNSEDITAEEKIKKVDNVSKQQD